MGARNYDDGVAQRSTMKTLGINRSGAYGRWAFAEFTDVYSIADEFAAATGLVNADADNKRIAG